MKKLTELERIDLFWSRVEVLGPDECWPWIGPLMGNGYGRAPGTKNYAHRFAWEIANGPIPKGEGYHGTCVCHSCDNKLCCNPTHLWLGSQGKNIRDAIDKGRHRIVHNRGENHGEAKLTEDQVHEIRHLVLDPDLSFSSIAERFGVSEPVVIGIARRTGWAHLEDDTDGIPLPERKGGRKGAAHPKHKLSDDDVREIRRLYSLGGITQTALGERYGVHNSVISMIVNRKMWKHLD